MKKSAAMLLLGALLLWLVSTEVRAQVTPAYSPSPAVETNQEAGRPASVGSPGWGAMALAVLVLSFLNLSVWAVLWLRLFQPLIRRHRKMAEEMKALRLDLDTHIHRTEDKTLHAGQQLRAAQNELQKTGCRDWTA